MKQFNNLLELNAYLSSEAKCRKYYEKFRWENGEPVCPHCDSKKVYRFSDGKLFKCAECRKKFTVTVGTIFENSKIPLKKWLLACYIMTSHKKGISSHQLAKDISVTQKSAWYMLMRIREMQRGKGKPQFEGTMEIDESFFGAQHRFKHKKERERLNQAGTGYVNKTPVFTILNRETKQVYTKVVEGVAGSVLKPIIYNEVKEGSTIVTDNFGGYAGLKMRYNHETVNHNQDEFVRGIYHTNTVEGYFSLLKRMIYGIYHQTSKKHLQRYCDEMSFRYSTRKSGEIDRFNMALSKTNSPLPYKQLVGK
jgi:transposase-like protein